MPLFCLKYSPFRTDSELLIMYPEPLLTCPSGSTSDFFTLSQDALLNGRSSEYSSLDSLHVFSFRNSSLFSYDSKNLEVLFSLLEIIFISLLYLFYFLHFCSYCFFHYFFSHSALNYLLTYLSQPLGSQLFQARNNLFA